ncbi:MAG TPA: magnesium chelatase, partial [Acidimicrobiia bacterium]|nr:magnesium chelatase [Acidimicrobiia bacterium]
IEALEEGREGEIVERLVKGAVLETWRAWCRPERFRDLVTAFDGGLAVDTGDDVPSSAYADFAGLPGIKETLGDLEVGEAPAEVASAVEFVLEGLHLSKRLNKDAQAGRATYRARS